MIEIKSIRHFKQIRKQNLAILESTTASVEEKTAAQKVLDELRLRFDSHGVPIPQPKEFDRGTPYPDEPEQTGGVDPLLAELFTPGITEKRASEITAIFKAERLAREVEDKLPI